MPWNACTHHSRVPWSSRAQLLQDTLVCGACCASTLAPTQPECAFYVNEPRMFLQSVCFPDSQALPQPGPDPGLPAESPSYLVGPMFRSISVTFQSSTSPWGPTMCSALLGAIEQEKIEARPCCLTLDGSHSPGASGVRCAPTVCRHCSWH